MTGTEAYIVAATRTPVGRRNGGLAAAHPADLAAHVLVEALSRAAVDADAVDDTLLTALYVELTDRIIPALGLARSGPGRPPQVTSAELVFRSVMTARRSGLAGWAGYGYWLSWPWRS
jgi:acetyl-CoA acetyltransferase